MSANRIQFGRTLSKPDEMFSQQDVSPLKVLLLTRADAEISEQKLKRLDHDTLPLLLAALPDLQIKLNMADQEIVTNLHFDDLTSFEPETIAAQIGVAVALDGLVRQLKTPALAESAAAQLMEMLGLPPSQIEVATAQASDDSGDFSRLMNANTQSENSPHEPSKIRLQSYIDKMVEKTSPERLGDHSQLAEQVNLAIQDLVRQVFSNPEFRTLERTWRGIDWVISNVELDHLVELSILPIDFSKVGPNETGFDPGADQSQSALYKVIHQHSAGQQAGYSVIAVDYDFQSTNDLNLLANLAQLAEVLDACLFANAPDSLTVNLSLPRSRNIEEMKEEHRAFWLNFMHTSAAAHCVVAAPRLLLRAPYGRKGEASSLASFEELGANPDHESFVWGNPIYGLLLSVCSAFETAEWDTDLETKQILEDLPLAIYDDGTGEAIKPATEIYLSERDASELANLGISSFAAVHNTTSVVLEAQQVG